MTWPNWPRLSLGYMRVSSISCTEVPKDKGLNPACRQRPRPCWPNKANRTTYMETKFECRRDHSTAQRTRLMGQLTSRGGPLVSRYTLRTISLKGPPHTRDVALRYACQQNIGHLGNFTQGSSPSVFHCWRTSLDACMNLHTIHET